MAEAPEKKHRLDHWLKLCCIYKQRSDATDACSGGRVKLNGQRAKPATEIKENDVIEISGNHPRKLVVLGLPTSSIAKEIARTMYRDETPPPETKAKPEDDWFQAAMAKAPQRERGAGRPTKRDRRDIERGGTRRER
jgi:ribosome-associated heat shock protein Hsp15